MARVHDPTPHTHTRIAIVYRRQTGMVVGFEIRVRWCDETGRQRAQELLLPVVLSTIDRIGKPFYGFPILLSF